MSKNDPICLKLAFFVHCRLIWGPVGGLSGGCGAGCISQDTYLLYLVIKPFFDAFLCKYKKEITILLFWSVNKEKSKQLEERKKSKQSQSGMVYIGAKVATLLFSFLNRQWGVRKGVGWMGQYISGTLCTVQYCTYVYKVA